MPRNKGTTKYESLFHCLLVRGFAGGPDVTRPGRGATRGSTEMEPTASGFLE